MGSAERKKLLKRGLIGLWAMATVTLVFMIGLLFYEMVQQGANPLVLPEQEFPEPSSVLSQEQTPTRDVRLFFADSQGFNLIPESTRYEHSDYTVRNCRRVLEALIEGPRDIATPTLPANTDIRAVYLLEGGELVIDFSGELVRGLPPSVSAEVLMIQSIAHTLTQNSVAGRRQGSVQRVRLLIEGGPVSDYLSQQPRHLDMARSFEPDRHWLQAVETDDAG